MYSNCILHAVCDYGVFVFSISCSTGCMRARGMFKPTHFVRAPIHIMR